MKKVRRNLRGQRPLKFKYLLRWLQELFQKNLMVEKLDDKGDTDSCWNSRSTHLMTSDGKKKQGEEGECMAMVMAMQFQ